MNWEAIGAVAELLGALGVIATLVYLSIQIRQNTRMMKSTALQSIADTAVGISTTLATDPMLATSLIRAVNDEELEEDEKLRLWSWYGLNFRNFENYFVQHAAGVVTTDVFESRMESFKILLKSNQNLVYWERARHVHDTSFAEYVDKLIKQNKVDSES